MEPSSEYDYFLKGACLPAAGRRPQEKAFLESFRVFPVRQFTLLVKAKPVLTKSTFFLTSALN